MQSLCEKKETMEGLTIKLKKRFVSKKGMWYRRQG